MAQHMGMAEFFAMEAGEYLERLDGLVSRNAIPDADELVRLTRALRGSALMANQQAIAGVAAGLEALARAVRESRRQWDALTRQVAVRTVDDLKILVRSLTQWSPREEEKAQALARELEQLAGVRPPSRPSGKGPDTGTRAFVAREGAAVASELDRAGISLSQNSPPGPVTTSLLKAMQPLRGLAGLSDLAPLPDILDGVERAVAAVSQGLVSAAQAGAVLRAASRALSRAAREAATGSVTTDAPELGELADQLQALLEPEHAAVPIESLFYDDAGPHVVEGGTVAPRRESMVRVELVALGDHLKQAADALERAASPAQRDLRAQTLTPTLRALGAAGGSIAAFAAAAREALSRVGGLREVTPLTGALRDAGKLLSHASGTDDQGLTESLARIAAALRTMAPAPATAPRRISGPAPAPAGDGPGETGDLVGSLLRLARYQHAMGPGTPSIDELLAGPPATDGSTEAGGENGIFSIRDLCYSGPAALERALSLRDEVQTTLTRGGSGERLLELVEEIFDLVQLGLQRRG